MPSRGLDHRTVWHTDPIQTTGLQRAMPGGHQDPGLVIEPWGGLTASRALRYQTQPRLKVGPGGPSIGRESVRALEHCLESSLIITKSQLPFKTYPQPDLDMALPACSASPPFAGWKMDSHPTSPGRMGLPTGCPVLLTKAGSEQATCSRGEPVPTLLITLSFPVSL